MEGKFSFDLDDFCSTYYCNLYPIDALTKFEGEVIVGDIRRAIEAPEGHHQREGRTAAEWIATWKRSGRKKARKALVRAYKAVAKKSRKWDEEARAKDWLLREYAGDGGAIPNQLNQISA
jgi:hypothetical protein